MWYGSTKVGILDIDTDHGNIDMMLQLYYSGDVDDNYLEDIVFGLYRHFDHEINVIESLGGIFPQSHKEEHQRLKDHLSLSLDDVKSGKIAGRVLAEEIRSLLLLHVVDFDLELRSCLP
jgi:hemerythrin